MPAGRRSPGSRRAGASAIDVGELSDAFEATLPWPLDDFQREAIHKLERHRGLIVSAPTSSGKTVVAEYAIWRRIEAPNSVRAGLDEPNRVVYTTPLKALSNQKYHDLCKRYSEENVGLVTGEHTINESAPVVVMTTEILRNVLYDEPQRVDLVSDVVLDEIHYIDDYPRGTVWEEVIIEAPPHIRMIGLSATITNIEEVAAWMSARRGPVATVVRTQRPVDLVLWLSLGNRFYPLFDSTGHVAKHTLALAQYEDVHESRLRYVRRAPDNDLLRVLDELRAKDMLPAIYFIFSRRGCREALARCAVHGTTLTNDRESRRIAELYREQLQLMEDEDERAVFSSALNLRLLRRGVAMHHAGMLPSAKETVERLFADGLIKVVFATETLSLGLNMPARACVVSSFSKFDGISFKPLTSSELTQLMGRAGRRGIDTLGHGIILKDQDTDVRDIYEAATGGEMAVISKFAPTYNMVLNLLRTRSVDKAEQLLESSFGHYQNMQRTAHWEHKRENLQSRLEDLRARVFRHPTVPCDEATLTSFLSANGQLGETQAALRRARREHWRDRRRRRYGPGGNRSLQRYEKLQRSLDDIQEVLRESPCADCPYLSEHRANRFEIHDVEETLRGGDHELREASERYRREFQAFRAVLTQTGFIANDHPTELGMLAASLYGESSLLITQAITAGEFSPLEPPELAAAIVMLVAEDRGRDRPPPSRRRFPTPALDHFWRAMRRRIAQLDDLEKAHGLDTLRPLSFDYVNALYEWTSGVALADIDTGPAVDIGDVVKAAKNVYSMLRQMEQALRGHGLHPLVSETRERLERDLIRRV